MSTELPPLPPSVNSTGTMTYTVPDILLPSDPGHMTIRRGYHAQVTYRTVVTYTDEKEQDTPLKILARNRVNFGQHILDVLNDAGDFDGKTLPASAPSASALLERLGKETLIAFKSEPIATKEVKDRYQRACIYRNSRTFIVIPEKAT